MDCIFAEKSKTKAEADRFNAGPPSYSFAEKMRAEKAKSYEYDLEESVASTSKSAAHLSELPRSAVPLRQSSHFLWETRS